MRRGRLLCRWQRHWRLGAATLHFTIDDGERHIGDMNRRLGYRDTYDLDVSGDVERKIDRRLAVSLGIALDALQSR